MNAISFIMNEALIKNAIRDPSSVHASEIMSGVTPDILKDTMPDILTKVNSGAGSEQLAESTVNGILDTVEDRVLGDSFDFALDKFGDRILEMIINGPFLHIFEKVSLLFN